jgi:hypothetical protein
MTRARLGAKVTANRMGMSSGAEFLLFFLENKGFIF